VWGEAVVVAASTLLALDVASQTALFGVVSVDLKLPFCCLIVATGGGECSCNNCNNCNNSAILLIKQFFEKDLSTVFYKSPENVSCNF
jgi:hypothetical protein